MCHAVEDRGEVRSQRASVGLSTRARTAAARCRARIRARCPRIHRQDESPQPLPALLSSFGIAASIRTTAELVVSILLQPTHPPSESDQRRDEATWLLHQSQQGRRGRRHHLFIYNHQSQQSPRERRHHIHSSKSSQPADRHVHMISKSTRSSTRPAGGATMRSFELGGMPACSSTDSCRSTDNFRSTDTRSSASSSVPVGLCALFPAHRGQP